MVDAVQGSLTASARLWIENNRENVDPASSVQDQAGSRWADSYVVYQAEDPRNKEGLSLVPVWLPSADGRSLVSGTIWLPSSTAFQLQNQTLVPMSMMSTREPVEYHYQRNQDSTAVAAVSHTEQASQTKGTKTIDSSIEKMRNGARNESPAGTACASVSLLSAESTAEDKKSWLLARLKKEIDRACTEGTPESRKSLAKDLLDLLQKYDCKCSQQDSATTSFLASLRRVVSGDPDGTEEASAKRRRLCTNA
jgi:hypothetical protein